MAENVEDLVPNSLRIFGRVEHLVQVDSTPAQISAKLKQVVADPAIVSGNGAKDE